MKKHRIKTIFFWIALSIMLMEMLVLCLEALRPGTESSKNSTLFGDAVDSILTEASDDSIRDVPPVKISIGVKKKAVEELSFDCGETVELSILFEPENTSVNYRRAVWNSSDPSVVSVKNGKLFGISVGEAVITATLVKENLSCSIPVTVEERIAQKFSLLTADGEETLSVEEGGSRCLTALFEPEDITDATVIYRSEDPEVATVSSNGTVHGIQAGETEIVATYTPRTDPESALVARIPVSVTERTTELVLPTAIKLLPPEDGMEEENGTFIAYAGRSVDLSVQFAPEETTERALIWQSSNRRVLTVTQSGKITANQKGTAVITVLSAADSDVKATFPIEVRNAALDVEIEATGARISETADHIYSLSLSAGDHDVRLSAEGRGDLYVRYESMEPAILEVFDDGLISTLSSSKQAEGGRVIVKMTVADNAGFSSDRGNFCETFTILIFVQKQNFSAGIGSWGTLVRKLFGHFGAFLLLGVTAAVTAILYDNGSKKRRVLLLAGLIAGGFSFACLTEFLQMDLFTVGRAAAFTDVVIDCSGYMPGALTVYGIFLVVVIIIDIVRYIIKKKGNRKAQK